MSSTAPGPRTRNLAWLGWLGLVLAAGGCLAAFPLSDAEWWQVAGSGQMLTSGRAVTSGLTSTVPTAVMAGLALTLVFGPRGRRVVGGLVAALGAVMALTALTALPPDDFDTPLSRGATGRPVHTDQFGMYVAAALAVAVGGAMLALWPGRSRRRSERAESAWTVLDRGGDPTDD